MKKGIRSELNEKEKPTTSSSQKNENTMTFKEKLDQYRYVEKKRESMPFEGRLDEYRFVEKAKMKK